MNKNKLSKAYSTIEYDGFTGTDVSKIFNGEGGTKSLTDFRVRFDGALEKRGGLRKFADFTGNVRAVHQLSSDALLLLVDHTVYWLYLSTGAARPMSDVATTTGEASFFSFKGSIYLLDGNKLYVMSSDYFIPVTGYVPLYGKEWHPYAEGNEVNEPLNVISQRVRISFRVPDQSSNRFHLPFYTTHIDHVTRNGIIDDLEIYSISEERTTIYAEAYFNSGDIIEFFLTISNTYVDPSLINSCKCASVYGDGSSGADKVFIAFYNGADKNIIYPTSTVDEDQLKICNDIYGSRISDIYIKSENAISANDGRGNITDVCQKDDGLMVFTDDRAFMLTTDESGKNHFVRVSLGTGCSSSRGAVISDDTPITVSYYGIFKWDPSSYEEGEYRARCISRPINELLDDRFFSTAIAYHYRKKGELWFCSSGDPQGTVHIYSIDSEAWYSFKGIGAEFFFEYNGELGLIKGSKAYIFAPDKTSDTVGENEREVCARFESGCISFGGFWEKKRLSRCIIRTSPGATVKLTVNDAEGQEYSFSLSDGSGERMGYIDKRLTVRRSRHYSFAIEAVNSAVIYGVTLLAVD